jgi:hypothetical protein
MKFWKYLRWTGLAVFVAILFTAWFMRETPSHGMTVPNDELPVVPTIR